MIRSFHVRPVLNGYIVDIGCQQVVFTSIVSLTNAIETYLKEPDETESHWLRTALNAKHKYDVPDQCEETRAEINCAGSPPLGPVPCAPEPNNEFRKF